MLLSQIQCIFVFKKTCFVPSCITWISSLVYSMGWFVPTSSACIGNNFCRESKCKSRAELAKLAWAIMPRCSFAYAKKKRPATSPTRPLCITWLYATFNIYTTFWYTDNKVKLSVYPYKRMGIVTTASLPIFSFHGIPLFLFSSLILSSKPHICT